MPSIMKARCLGSLAIHGDCEAVVLPSHGIPYVELLMMYSSSYWHLFEQLTN